MQQHKAHFSMYRTYSVRWALELLLGKLKTKRTIHTSFKDEKLYFP